MDAVPVVRRIFQVTAATVGEEFRRGGDRGMRMRGEPVESLGGACEVTGLVEPEGRRVGLASLRPGIVVRAENGVEFGGEGTAFDLDTVEMEGEGLFPEGGHEFAAREDGGGVVFRLAFDAGGGVDAVADDIVVAVGARTDVTGEAASAMQSDADAEPAVDFVGGGAFAPGAQRAFDLKSGAEGAIGRVGARFWRAPVGEELISGEAGEAGAFGAAGASSTD